MSKLPTWLTAAILLALAAAVRFLPGLPPNFSPVGAMGLYAGAALPLPAAIALSLGGLFGSDLVIGLYDPVTMLFVYLGTAANAVLGYFLPRPDHSFSLRLAIFLSLMGAVAFFALSNFGVWLSGELYPRNFHGLLSCYVAAIPFFRNTLASQLLFSAVLFGAHRLAPHSPRHSGEGRNPAPPLSSGGA